MRAALSADFNELAEKLFLERFPLDLGVSFGRFFHEVVRNGLNTLEANSLL
ncbi:MAG: hypothetical protein ABSG31_14510 [Tepidisphaeraceae bacterium]|jgi:hypothetical protein